MDRLDRARTYLAVTIFDKDDRERGGVHFQNCIWSGTNARLTCGTHFHRTWMFRPVSQRWPTPCHRTAANSFCARFTLMTVFFFFFPLFLSLIGVTPRAVRSAFEGGVSRAALVMMRSLSTSMSAQERRVNDLYAPGILQPTMYGCRMQRLRHDPPSSVPFNYFRHKHLETSLQPHPSPPSSRPP